KAPGGGLRLPARLDGCRETRQRQRQRPVWLAVDERAKPELDLEQRPDLARLVGSARLVVVQHALDRGSAEDAAADGYFVQQHLARQPPELPPKPVSERNTEAVLRALDDMGGHPRAHDVAQDAFPRAAVELRVERQSGGELRDVL